MQAVIMAGGKGSRLAALTKDEIPKPMAPFLGKPLLEWQLRDFHASLREPLFHILVYPYLSFTQAKLLQNNENDYDL